ncbi:MAG: T9SS type A sorting domain-containing protein [Bacteroidia bacterium]
MRKILLSLTLFATIISVHAQSVVDSAMMTSGYTTDIFYSMKNGVVAGSGNSTWHLAFATRPSLFPNNTLQSTSIRINEARGVNVFKSTYTVAQWKTFDSTGFSSWTSLHDNDSSWDLSAFNYGLSIIPNYNYGWGSYDMTSHDVIGTNVYLIRIKSGTTYSFRKFMIQRLVYDSQWVFTFSNLDGTDSNTVRINKSAYANKLFAYYNLTTKTASDREPNQNLWDVIFTYFNTPVLLGPPPAVQYNVAGVLANPRVPTARVMHVSKSTITPTGVNLISQANNINWDWANPPMGPPPADYSLIDSMVFFIQSQADTNIYRLYFTKFTVNDPGKFVFNKTMFTKPVGIAEVISSKNEITVYPNPANSVLNISSVQNNISLISIYDITGRKVETRTLNNESEVSIDISHLNKGIYFMTVETGSSRITKKIIIE